METTENKYGMSKKTNIAVVAIGGLATAAEHGKGLVAIGVVAMLALTYQFILDYRKASK